MRKRISTLNLLFGAIVCQAFEFKCPDRSEWRFRAGAKCNGTINTYFCIFDDNDKIYSEFCHNDTRLNKGPKGQKIVYRGNLDGEICSAEKYQPVLFNAVGNSDCIFAKSLCNFEGHFSYDNGTAKSDRTCSCDNTKNYYFITQPKDKCKCSPDVEECSCFMKTCQKDYWLSKDVTCESKYQVQDNNKLSNNCNRSGTFQQNTSTDRANVPFIINLYEVDINTSHSKVRIGRTVKIALTVGVATTIFFIVGCCVCILKCHYEEDDRVQNIPNSPQHSTDSILLNGEDYTDRFALHQINTTETNNKKNVTLIVNLSEEDLSKLDSITWTRMSDGSQIQIGSVNRESSTLKTATHEIRFMPPILTIIGFKPNDCYVCYISSGEKKEKCSCLLAEAEIKAEHSICNAQPGVEVKIRANIARGSMGQVTWYKEDTVVPIENETYSFPSENVTELKISNVQKEDVGTYTCRLSNAFGHSECTTKLHVEAIITPRLRIKKTDEVDAVITVELPDSKTKLGFRAITWKKVNDDCLTEIGNLTSQNISPVSNTIQSIKYIVLKDPPSLKIFQYMNKEGYVCHVTYGEEEHVFSCVLERPTFRSTDEVYKASKRGKVDIDCEVYSTFIVDIRWDKDCETLDVTNTDKYQGGTVECFPLTIKDINEDDFGTYTCFADNGLGLSESAHMILKEKEHVDCKDEDTKWTTKVQQVRLKAKLVAKDQRNDVIGKEIRVAVIGKTGVGKSTLCNAIAEQTIFEARFSVKSVTQTTQFKSIRLPKQKDKNIVLIDTPGVFSHDNADSEAENKKIKEEIQKCIEVGAPSLHAILLLFKCGRLTHEDHKVIDTYKKYFECQNFNDNVIVVFTHSDLLQSTLDVFLSESIEIKDFLATIGNRYVSFTAKGTTDESKFKEVECLVKEILIHEYKEWSNSLFKEAERNIEKREDKTFDEIIQEKITDNLSDTKNIEELLNDFQKEIRKEILKLRNDLRDELVNKPFTLTFNS